MRNDPIEQLNKDRIQEGLPPVNNRIDAEAEMVLTELAVPFHYAILSLDDIDEKVTKRNPGRVDIADEMIYVEVPDSACFPALCVYKLSSGKYAIAGGWHRYIRYRERGTTNFAAIVFETDDEAIRSCVTFKLNRVTGQRTSIKEALIQAGELIDKHGWTIRDAADFMDVNERTLLNSRRRQEVSVSLQSHGLRKDQIDKLTSHKLHTLGRLEICPTVMTEVAKLATVGQHSDAELKKVVDDIVNIPTETERLAVVKEAIGKAQVLAKRPKSASKPKRKTLMQALANLETLLNGEATGLSLQLDADDVKDLKKRFSLLSKRVSLLTAG